VPETRYYRDVTVRQRIRDGRPHGWWILPEGPLKGHPDKAWVLTYAEAKAEIDNHVNGDPCLMRDEDQWLGVRPEVRRAADSMFELTMMKGYSPWCAARAAEPHEPCASRDCRCACHGGQ
jgi:hypothetical protein